MTTLKSMEGSAPARASCPSLQGVSPAPSKSQEDPLAAFSHDTPCPNSHHQDTLGLCSNHRLSQSPWVKHWAPEARGLGASGCSTCPPNRAAHTSQAAGNRNSFLKSMRWQDQSPDLGKVALCILCIRHLSAMHPLIQAPCMRWSRTILQFPPQGEIEPSSRCCP